MSVISKLLINQTSSLRRTEMDYYNIRDVAQDSHKGYKDLIANPITSADQTLVIIVTFDKLGKRQQKIATMVYDVQHQ